VNRGPGAYRRDHEFAAGDGFFGYGAPPHDPETQALMVELCRDVWRVLKYPFIITVFVGSLLCAGNGIAVIPMGIVAILSALALVAIVHNDR
jgi:hypothetical protein